MKNYILITKFGIVIFILLAASLGHLLGLNPEHGFSFLNYTWLLAGLFFLSSASFIGNQLQEINLDKQMLRTQNRPLANGSWSKGAAFSLATIFFLLGSFSLWKINLTTCLLGLLTILTYNGFYTMIWKPKWQFGAVPGAIPGALPVVIGYAAADTNIFSTQSVYLFMILFLWQMPHFWTLAIKLKDDYGRGSVPVLASKRDLSTTLYHIGLYTFAYSALAIASPLFVKAHVVYVAFVVPIAIKVLVEFFRYFQRANSANWLRWFIWVNVSLLFFLAAPAIDKWYLFLFTT